MMPGGKAFDEATTMGGFETGVALAVVTRPAHLR